MKGRLQVLGQAARRPAAGGVLPSPALRWQEQQQWGAGPTKAAVTPTSSFLLAVDLTFLRWFVGRRQGPRGTRQEYTKTLQRDRARCNVVPTAMA